MSRDLIAVRRARLLALLGAITLDVATLVLLGSATFTDSKVLLLGSLLVAGPAVLLHTIAHILRPEPAEPYDLR